MAGGTSPEGATKVANAAAKAEWDARWAAANAAAGVTNPTATPSVQEEAASHGPVPGSGTTSTNKSLYIGMDNVPAGYRPYVTVAPTVGGSPASRAGRSLGVPEGYQGIYKTGSDYTEWQDMNEAQRVQTKTQLWYAGFYGKNRPVLSGDISPEDITAMNGAMALGNLNGKKWEDAIAPRVTMGEQMGGAYDPNATKSSSMSSGTFDQEVTRLRDFALNNGIDLTEDYIGKTAQQIAGGQTNIDTVLGDLRDTHVARAYPGFAKQIMAGQDVRTIADPYIAKMANTLEVDPNTVSLNDPTLAKALQAVDEKGHPASVPLWQFDQMLKQDSRWQYTSNAWKDVGDQAMQIAQMFGIQG